MKNSIPIYNIRGDARLMEFLIATFPQKSRSNIKAMLAQGRVCVNGSVVTAYDRQLKAGDEVTLSARGSIYRKSSALTHFGNKLKIIYEDDNIIVIDKSSGLLTMSTGNENETTAYSMLTDYVRKTRGPHGRVFIVHRIDRETSGIVLFAKDVRTKEILQNNWNEIVLERKYIALTEGCPEPESGTIISWLSENPKSKKVSSCNYDDGGKKAITRYSVIGYTGQSGDASGHGRQSGKVSEFGSKNGNGYALVEFELDTGRKNQIRVHSAQIGHPIAGDKKYGSATNPIGRLALHARTLTFRHPITDKIMSFDSGIPHSFKISPRF